MGNNTLNAAVDGTPIPASDHNEFVTALCGNVVPRDAATFVAGDLKGSLGETANRFKRAEIAAGYWECGDMKMHDDYNGAVPVGHGWMKMNGRQVTKANYETEHGAGTWDIHIVSSPLLNLYLADFTQNSGCFPVGAAATAQDGTIAKTSVGNANNTTSHSHTVAAHTHDLGNHTHSGTGSTVSNSPGVNTGPTSPSGGPSTNTSGSASPGTDSQTVNVKPESFATLYYMRII